jgi:hypothetical protein
MLNKSYDKPPRHLDALRTGAIAADVHCRGAARTIACTERSHGDPTNADYLRRGTHDVRRRPWALQIQQGCEK